MIYKPLTKIRVLKSSRKCKPGSLGYIITQRRPMRSLNLLHTPVLFSRFGKRGKPRAELLEINIPFIETKDLSPRHQKIYQMYRAMGNLEDDGRTKIDTLITPENLKVKNLLELENNDFIAYIAAASLFLNTVSPKHTNLSWALGIYGRQRNADISRNSLENIGLFIATAAERDRRYRSNDSQESIKRFFRHNAQKIQVISAIRKRISELSSRIMEHQYNMDSYEQSYYTWLRETLNASKDLIN
jgi:hypothetical protein